MQRRSYGPRANRKSTQFDAEKLTQYALRYVTRYATTQEKLRRYLARKLREGEWIDPQPPHIEALIERFVRQGFVNDEVYAASKVRSMSARGMGAMRTSIALKRDGIDEATRAGAMADAENSELQTAMIFARKRRFGPFGSKPPEAEVRRRQLAAFARAGHRYEIASKILDLNEEFVHDI